MAQIQVNAAQVAPVFPDDPSTVIRNYQLAVDVTAGQAAYCDPATGKAGLADAPTAAKAQFRGVFLRTRKAGETVAVIERGEVAGFNLSGVNFDALIYLDAAGALADAANGTKTVQVGRVKSISTLGAPTKVLYVQSDLLRNW
jgi:hypothetical protein